MIFSRFTELCHYHHSLVLEHFVAPKRDFALAVSGYNSLLQRPPLTAIRLPSGCEEEKPFLKTMV